MAREDDRERVAVHDDSDRAGGLRAMRLGRERSVGRDLAVRDTREPLQHFPVELTGHSQIDRELELRAGSVEVLVKLAAHRVDRLRRAEDANAELPCERLRD